MTPFFLIAAGVALAVVAFLIAAFAATAAKRFLAAHGTLFMAFAGGALLALALGHVLPESIEEGGLGMLWWALGGIILFYILEHLLCRHACPDHADHCGHHATEHRHAGQMTAIGLSIHSFFDGVIIVLAGLIEPAAALVVGGGIALHRLADGAVLAGVLTVEGHPHRLRWILAVGAMPLLGLLLIFAHEIVEPYLAIGAAISAGALFYVALAELLPRTHAHFRWMHLVWLLVGLSLVIGLELAAGHDHHHGHDHEYHDEHENEEWHAE